MKGKLFVLTVVAVISLVLPVLAKEPVYPDYKGFVNDYAGVIDASTRQKMEGLCRTLEEKTSAELAIATVKTVEPLDSKEYAVKLFEKWKIGKKGKDNGILILLAMEEKRIEIEVGYGLEGVITDAQAGEILDKYVVPSFKQGKFGEGLYNGAGAIANRVANQENEATDREQWNTALTILIFIAALFAFGIAVFFLSFFSSGLASGLAGSVIWGVAGYLFMGIIGAIIGLVIGFVLSYLNIKFPASVDRWSGGGWGGGFGGGGGGFGGFGGGRSGGGGAGRGW